MSVGKLKKAEEMRSIAHTPSSPRIDEYGLLYITGFTIHKLEFSLDIYRATGAFMAELAQHSTSRARRFAKWTQGQPVHTFWYEKRKELAEDIETFKAMLQNGGYE